MSFEVETGYIVPELYDVIYWYADDIAFYVATARDARGPVFEIGCGTGRILIPTLAAGVDGRIHALAGAGRIRRPPARARHRRDGVDGVAGLKR